MTASEPQGTASEPQGLSPDARRLHRHLGLAGSFARPSTLVEGRLDLFRKDGKGPTLGAGSLDAGAATELLDLGLATWRGDCLAASSPGAGTVRGPRDLAMVERSEATGAAVIVNRAESPLAWLAARQGADGRPLLSVRCVVAGERLRADLERGAMLPRLGVDWSRPPGAGGGPLRFEPGESALAARQRCEAALASVGRDLSGLLVDVCGFLKGLSVVELERGWPPRSARIVLDLALRRLADHYGLSDEATGPATSRRPGHVWRPAQAVPDGMPRSG